MLPFKGEPLQAGVDSIRDHDGRIASRPVVDPDAMGQLELAVLLAWASEAGEPFARLVVPVDAPGAVAVRQLKTAGRMKSEIRRHEPVASPNLFRTLGLALGVAFGVHRGAFFPNYFTVQIEFREEL